MSLPHYSLQLALTKQQTATIVLCSAFLIFYIASVRPIGQYRKKENILHKVILPVTSAATLLVVWIVTAFDQYINSKVKQSLKKQDNIDFEAGQLVSIVVQLTNSSLTIYRFTYFLQLISF